MIDGIVLRSMINELNDLLQGGRIDKITQPEKDEILLSIRSNSTKYKLLLSAQASMPRIHLTESTPKSPQNAPSFCMLLRKYIGNGRIKEISQVGLERIAEIRLEQLNELGDLCEYCLRIEIMGKHSNIILCDQQNMILDSVKRIGLNVSSVRQVYPNLSYEYPPNKDKLDLLSDFPFNEFLLMMKNSKDEAASALYKHIQGLSPFYAAHLCHSIELDSGAHVLSLLDEDLEKLYKLLLKVKESLLNKQSQPVLISQKGELQDFHSLLLTPNLPLFEIEQRDSMSYCVDFFYATKAVQVRMKQKTQDLRKVISNALERCYKKLDLQEKQFRDTKDMDQFKIRGELILANQYQIKTGMKNITVLNYYTNEEITLPLDDKKSPIENANKAFEKYTKKKRTKEALIQQIESTQKEISHLESVKYAVENILFEEDIEDIRKELMETGY
ncbi:MAG: NFACT family protein, partial [Vallitaleaceae bacterium]|nr:NFACT family protein [Vallitaleaceae bacterium]